MQMTILYRVMAGVLLGFVLGGIPALAQLTVEPTSLTVEVEQYATATQTVRLKNMGTETLTFCLSFDRPLQRDGSVLWLSKQIGSMACGEYGEILYRYDGDNFENDTGGRLPSLYSVTMTPDGRLFTNESGGLNRTFEFTPELEFLRSFEHPHVAEYTPFNSTNGITHEVASGTLWWMNTEREGGQGGLTRRVLLLEGSLDGEETGNRIEILSQEVPLEFRAIGLSYDFSRNLFFFTGILGNGDNPANWALWAVDREGTLADGYPLRPEPYPPPALIGRPDTHGGDEEGADGVRIEYGAYPWGSLGYDRVVVVDRWGVDEGTELETPVPDVLFDGGGAGINGNPLRSRIDPNGVMYVTFRNFESRGIVGVRPHPLPPSWLVVDSDAGPEAAWDGVLAPGESRTLLLTFRAGAREVGDYTASLQVFEAASGAAMEVPLTLTVVPGVDTEDGAETEGASRLEVYPNPASGEATVALTLEVASEVRVVVYDVLGRRVALLHDGPLGAGEHALAFESARLPAGVYLVRAEGSGFGEARRVTLVR